MGLCFDFKGESNQVFCKENLAKQSKGRYDTVNIERVERASVHPCIAFARLTSDKNPHETKRLTLERLFRAGG